MFAVFLGSSKLWPYGLVQVQQLLQKQLDCAHQNAESRAQAEAELQEAQGLLQSQAQTMAVLTAELNASQVQIADLLQAPQVHQLCLPFQMPATYIMLF